MITQEQIDKEVKRYTKEKIVFCIKERFFGMLSSALNLIPSDRIPTMAVDGKNIYINPTFADSLSRPEYRGVLAHEILHCALLHFARLGDRDPELANAAQDYAINNDLDTYFANKSDTATLPKGALIDHRFDGKAWEEIYRILQKEGKGGKKGQDQGNDGIKGNGHGGDVIYQEGKEGISDLEKTWKNAAVQAAHVCKAQGNLPGSFQTMVDELITPKIDFRQYFFNFVAAKIRDDYSWLKPDSRMLNCGFYWPTLQGEQLGPIALAVDTSGSVSDEDFKEVLGVTQSILENCRPEKMVFIQCDSNVHEVREFSPDDSLQGLTLKGRGGTDFRPVFEALEKYEKLECLVFLTDLYGTFPDKAPPYRVLWITKTKDYKVPFGETVFI